MNEIKNLRVLVIDDYTYYGDLFRRKIESALNETIEFHFAVNANEGLSKLQSRRYDYIFIDACLEGCGVKLPDGYEIMMGAYLAELARKFTDAKLIALTAWDLSQEDGKDRFDAILTKPVLSKSIEKIKSVLENA